MTAHCLRWVNTLRPPVEPIALPRAEALPEHLHPCGIWGDLLESPTEREEMGSPPRWPPPDMDTMEPPPGVTMVYPTVRDPAGRETAAVLPSRRRGEREEPEPRRRPTAEERERRKRARTEREPGTVAAAAPSEAPSTSSAAVPPTPPEPSSAQEEPRTSVAPATPQAEDPLQTPLARALTGKHSHYPYT